MPHEPSRVVSRRGICLHAAQHGGVSCIGFTNPSVAKSGPAWQLRTEPLCSVQRMKVRGLWGPHLHGGWGRVLDFVLVLDWLGQGAAMHDVCHVLQIKKGPQGLYTLTNGG